MKIGFKDKNTNVICFLALSSVLFCSLLAFKVYIQSKEILEHLYKLSNPEEIEQDKALFKMLGYKDDGSVAIMRIESLIDVLDVSKTHIDNLQFYMALLCLSSFVGGILFVYFIRTAIKVERSINNASGD
ncbi:hypothetical protein [Catenovulum sediminis]|uniref:Uncharacterized protein n=1 Tax=Catenovulum sediminis TaxID=1740262 RepID=A0ABV1RCG9_9ALTE|nr:hypothetical protein [Catenovulum sediminis]